MLFVDLRKYDFQKKMFTLTSSRKFHLFNKKIRRVSRWNVLHYIMWANYTAYVTVKVFLIIVECTAVVRWTKAVEYRSFSLAIRNWIKNIVTFFISVCVSLFFVYIGNESLASELRYLCAAELYMNSASYANYQAFSSDDDFGMCLSGSAEKVFTLTKDRWE